MAPIEPSYERIDYGPSFTQVYHNKSGLVAAAVGGGLLALIFLYFYGVRIVLAFLYLFFPCWCKRPPPSAPPYRMGSSNRVPRPPPVMRLRVRTDPPPAYASTSSLPSFSERDPALPPIATEDSNVTGIEIPCSIPLPTSPPLEQGSPFARGSPETTQAASPTLPVTVPPTTRPHKAHIRGTTSHTSAQRSFSVSSLAPPSVTRAA